MRHRYFLRQLWTLILLSILFTLLLHIITEKYLGTRKLSSIRTEYTASSKIQYVQNYVGRLLQISDNEDRQTSAGDTRLVLFTTWVADNRKYHVHNATMNNWEKLRPWVQPVVFTDDDSITRQVREHGWETLPMKRKAPNGKPLLKDMFQEIGKHYQAAPLIGFSNADILYTDGLLDTLQVILHPNISTKPALAVGARTNVDHLTFAEMASWDSLSKAAAERGSHFKYFWAVDYFIVTRSYRFDTLPDLAVGVRDYDNFMIWFANVNNIPTIDTTNSVIAVHFTTGTGNHEGRSAEDPDYNRKIFKANYPDFAPARGFLHCTKYLTARAYGDGKISLLRRDATVGNCANPDLSDFSSMTNSRALPESSKIREKLSEALRKHHKDIFQNREEKTELKTQTVHLPNKFKASDNNEGSTLTLMERILKLKYKQDSNRVQRSEYI